MYERKYIDWSWYQGEDKDAESLPMPAGLGRLLEIPAFANLVPHSWYHKKKLKDMPKLKRVWGRDVIYALLDDLACYDFPKNKKQLKEEQAIVRILMADGKVDPLGYRSESSTFSGVENSYFCFFLRCGKIHEALAVFPKHSFNLGKVNDPVFRILLGHLQVDPAYDWYCSSSAKDNLYRWGKTTDPQEKEMFSEWKRLNRLMIYKLFQYGIFPTDENVLKDTVPIVMKQDKLFFTKLKQQMIHRISHTHAPASLCLLVPQREYT